MEKIQEEDISIARAKSIARAVLLSEYVDKINQPTFYSNGSSVEIYFDIKAEVASRSAIDIQHIEPIKIVCHKEDKYTPEVYAIREDFPLCLSHTNLMKDERPVSLCITEDDFREARIRFSANSFIKQIHIWLSKTSRGILHAEDQPLEPYSNCDKLLIGPTKFEIDDYFSISQLENNINRITKGNDRMYIGTFYTIAKTSGYVTKKTSTLRDLSPIYIMFKDTKISIADFLLNVLNYELQKCCKDIKNRFSNLTFSLIIPLSRDAKSESETNNIYTYSFQESLWEIGVRFKLFLNKDRKRHIKNFSQRLGIEDICKLPIEQYLYYPDLNRFSASIFSGVESIGCNITMIGVGSLGSNILNTCIRGGFGRWNIIDNDILLPHNLVRHALHVDSIGKKKAITMADFCNNLLGEDIVSAYDIDFTTINSKANIDFIKESSLIIDCSTSIQVARKLSLDLEDISARRISTFLSPSGLDLVLLAEDSQRKHRLDLIEMSYYKTIIDTPSLEKHLEVKTNGRVRYNRNSCREITSTIKYSNVLQLSSIVSKDIMKIASSDQFDALGKIYRIDKDTNTTSVIEIKNSQWDCINTCNGWSVYMAMELLELLKGIRSKKIRERGTETGGTLLGSYDVERKIIYIYSNITAPPDSVETKSSFTRGNIELEENVKTINKITGGQTLYIGEWHSHPDGCSTEMSRQDKQLFEYLEEKVSGYQPAVMLIIGQNDNNYNVIDI